MGKSSKKGSHGGGGKGGKGTPAHPWSDGKGKGYGPTAPPELGDLKESEVQFGEASRDVILNLIANLMQARGVAVPSGHKNRKQSKKEDAKDEVADDDAVEDEALEDDDDDDRPEESSDEEASKRAEKEAKKAEERVKRRLMRQLLHEDRRAAKEGREEVAPEVKKKVPTGSEVRLHLWMEDKRHEKPKGPISFPRGGEDAVQEVIKVAKQKLNVKAGGKKEFWIYVYGGPTRDDKQHKNPIPLTDTSGLANNDIVILTSKEVPKQIPQEAPAPAAAASSPAAAAAASSAGGGGGASAEGVDTLDAVRAAYRARSGSKGTKHHRSPEAAAAESEALAAHARAWAEEARYAELRQVRAALPAAKVRGRLLEALERAQVVVVSGETGSGKTTQCPHFILEDYTARGRGGACSIVCTQPRRIAALGVAERVCYERGEQPGGAVGYAVRLDSCSSSKTRLLFCTTGVLLQQLNDDPDLKHVTHIVVDEAHERNLQTDFLLTILRDLLPRRPELKLILMSATLEQGLFVDYFSKDAQIEREVPSVHIPGRTHPVQVRFLNEVEAAIKGRAIAPAESAAICEVDEELQEWIKLNHGAEFARKGNLSKPLISPVANEKLDFKMLADLVAVLLRGEHGPDGDKGVKDDGAILIFLPGHMEIERALTQLRNHPGVGDQWAWLLPLHGQMPTHRQRLVFSRPPNSRQRKVVLATNIAETCITIDDVTHVIDCGHVKENRYDPRSRMGILATCFVSQAAAKQRAGRAGRVRPGICWRLFSSSFFEQLPDHTLCEMRRTALEELVLQLRLLRPGGHPGEMLRRAPEPPSREALDAALRTLIQIGALGPTSEGLPLTPLGFHLAHMPMDVRTAKMLLYGAVTRCLSPILTIAACLSEKTPFERGFGGKGREEQLRHQREAAFGDLRSDHLAVVRVFDDWLEASAGGRQASREFCDKFGLAGSVLESMSALRGRYLRHLQDVGFVPKSFSVNSSAVGPRGADRSKREAGEEWAVEMAATNEAPDEWNPDANSREMALLRCVLCAGLYPNVAQIQRVSNGKGTGTRTFLVSVGDLDRCVLHPGGLNARGLSDMKANHGWLLYHTKVKTSQVFLHDSTLIGSIPLLLFGGGDLQLAKDRRTMVLDGSMRFDAGRKGEDTAVLLKLLRKEVDRLLVLKIANPSANISRTAEPLLEAVARLLRLEGTHAGGLKKYTS